MEFFSERKFQGSPPYFEILAKKKSQKRKRNFARLSAIFRASGSLEDRKFGTLRTSALPELCGSSRKPKSGHSPVKGRDLEADFADFGLRELPALPEVGKFGSSELCELPPFRFAEAYGRQNRATPPVKGERLRCRFCRFWTVSKAGRFEVGKFGSSEVWKFSPSGILRLFTEAKSDPFPGKGERFGARFCRFETSGTSKSPALPVVRKFGS